MEYLIFDTETIGLPKTWKAPLTPAWIIGQEWCNWRSCIISYFKAISREPTGRTAMRWHAEGVFVN